MTIAGNCAVVFELTGTTATQCTHWQTTKKADDVKKRNVTGTTDQQQETAIKPGIAEQTSGNVFIHNLSENRYRATTVSLVQHSQTSTHKEGASPTAYCTRRRPSLTGMSSRLTAGAQSGCRKVRKLFAEASATISRHLL